MLGTCAFRHALTSSFINSPHSAKELEHYERVRKTFDTSGESTSGGTGIPSRPQTIRRDSALQSKQKNKERSSSKGKGKGKAPVSDWGDVADDEPGDDEGDPSSNHHANINGHTSTNGWGKGKSIDRNFGADGFGDPSENDEEELYG